MTAKSVKVLGWWLVAGGSLLLAAHPASAQEGPTDGDPLGVYVGAGLGLSTIRQDSAEDSDSLGGAMGWDVFAGIRPLPYLGAEIGYLDFGSTHRYEYRPTPFAFDNQSRIHESADAPVAFAVGYIPLQPWWDLYLKAGGARLHRSWDTTTPAPCSTPYACAAGYFPSAEDSKWDFAYGVGTQWKFGPVAWRLEYERVNANDNESGGDPDLLSLGVSWTFF